MGDGEADRDEQGESPARADEGEEDTESRRTSEGATWMDGGRLLRLWRSGDSCGAGGVLRATCCVLGSTEAWAPLGEAMKRATSAMGASADEGGGDDAMGDGEDGSSMRGCTGGMSRCRGVLVMTCDGGRGGVRPKG